MTTGDRIKITRGPYHGHEADVVRKVCGANDGWLCRAQEFPELIMVYANEVEHEVQE